MCVAQPRVVERASEWALDRVGLQTVARKQGGTIVLGVSLLGYGLTAQKKIEVFPCKLLYENFRGPMLVASQGVEVCAGLVAFI